MNKKENPTQRTTNYENKVPAENIDITSMSEQKAVKTLAMKNDSIDDDLTAGYPAAHCDPSAT